MKVRYDKLWRLMKDNQMKKSELAKAAEISSYAMTKLNHDRPVSMEIMINLRKVFHCDIGDLMETSLDKGTQRKTTENELPSLTQCTA